MSLLGDYQNTQLIVTPHFKARYPVLLSSQISCSTSACPFSNSSWNLKWIVIRLPSCTSICSIKSVTSRLSSVSISLYFRNRSIHSFCSISWLSRVWRSSRCDEICSASVFACSVKHNQPRTASPFSNPCTDPAWFVQCHFPVLWWCFVRSKAKPFALYTRGGVLLHPA